MDNNPEQKRFLQLSAGLAGAYEVISYVLANLMPPIGIPDLSGPVVVQDVVDTFERIRLVLIQDQPLTEDAKFLIRNVLMDWMIVSELGARVIQLGFDQWRLDAMEMQLMRVIAGVEIFAEEIGIDLSGFNG